LVGVELDQNGRSTKWRIENSWGKTANDGHLIATDKWMDEYLFRLVVERRFVPQNLLDILSQKATVLPCWDPMF
jgi:bleomycin hydrolase